MKVRVGFVSNSSSSSFICFGLKITHSEFRRIFSLFPGSEDDKYDMVYNEGLIMGENIGLRCYGEDDFYFIGVDKTTSEDYGINEFNIDLNKVKEQIELAKTKYELSGEPKLYFGTKQC